MAQDRRAELHLGLTIADLASELAHHGALVPMVRQATLDGRKVVIVSSVKGSKLYVANTGPAYPLRLEAKGQDPGVLDFAEYSAPCTSPRPATPSTTQASSTGPGWIPMKPEPDRLLTIEETAEGFNTKPRFVRRLIAERRIQYAHVGRHVRISESAVRELIRAILE